MWRVHIQRGGRPGLAATWRDATLLEATYQQPATAPTRIHLSALARPPAKAPSPPFPLRARHGPWQEQQNVQLVDANMPSHGHAVGETAASRQRCRREHRKLSKVNHVLRSSPPQRPW
jgi:hypothetical protein